MTITRNFSILAEGAGSANNLALGGATLGSNALAVTGTTLLNNALTYGGVTLNNAVTGTGNMVLSANATHSGNLTVTNAGATQIIAQSTTNSTYPTLYLKSNNRSWWTSAIDSGTDAPFQIGVGAIPGTNPYFTIAPTTGAVGIGMTPVNILDITQNQNAGSFVNILNNNASGGAYAAFQAGNGTKTVNFGMTGTGYTTSGILTPNIGYIYCSPGLSIGSGDVIKFSTAGLTEVARFDASGLFQLGTTGGIGALNVTAPASTRYAVFNAPTSGYAGMDLQSAGTRYATIGQASMRVTGGSDTDLALSAVNNLIFAHSSTEVARFDTSGNLLVGCTAQPSGSVKGAELGSNANKGYLFLATNTTASDTIAYFYNPNGLVGSITTSASATAYNTSSDARLKNNITDAGDAGAIIDALKVRQWDWKVDGLHQDFGFVAQEEAQVYAPAVTVGDDGEEIERQWQRDDSKLVPLLVKEIQSLRQRLAAAGIA